MKKYKIITISVISILFILTTILGAVYILIDNTTDQNIQSNSEFTGTEICDLFIDYNPYIIKEYETNIDSLRGESIEKEVTNYIQSEIDNNQTLSEKEISVLNGIITNQEELLFNEVQEVFRSRLDIYNKTFDIQTSFRNKYIADLIRNIEEKSILYSDNNLNIFQINYPLTFDIANNFEIDSLNEFTETDSLNSEFIAAKYQIFRYLFNIETNDIKNINFDDSLRLLSCQEAVDNPESKDEFYELIEDSYNNDSDEIFQSQLAIMQTDKKTVFESLGIVKVKDLFIELQDIANNNKFTIEIENETLTSIRRTEIEKTAICAGYNEALPNEVDLSIELALYVDTENSQNCFDEFLETMMMEYGNYSLDRLENN